MDLTQRSHQSLLPTFLYSPTPASGTRALDRILGRTTASTVAAGIAVSPAPIVAQAPNEPRKIEMYSLVFYAAGIASCGLTHMAVTPLDLVKCNMQIDPAKDWVPTLLGYSAQGACKFGFYEYFKKYFSDIVGPEYAAKYKTLIYLAGSASAKVIADVALCPFEAAKVFILLCSTLYTMMKFASFETVVEMIYKYAIPTPKDQCGKTLQLGVSFAGGYIAGIFCAIVSHPPNNLVSFLNNAKGATVGDTVKKLDLWGLFTHGLPLRIVMIGTLNWRTVGDLRCFQSHGWPADDWWSLSCTGAGWPKAA
ncbi:hypothetical protein OPV22_025697 [Ensete ventricosum]|uniref:Uncharacterized protein n=1 Tax=Ensete ventricosum TaxID=4639 RepID=A0AAV8QDR3_ENSVE|nr:hypothetical protein OPV22_025697 [Ensete ventricosum]